MSLFVRVDDFPGTKPEEFDKHNLENFKRFHHYLINFDNFRYTLGVIPGYTSRKDLLWLADQNIAIALHGTVHSEEHLDEFYGMQYGDIENALLNAKSFLESHTGTHIIDYIPPHNTINADTVLALYRLGFKRIYGGPETDPAMKELIKIYEMEYIHSEPPLEYGRTDELMKRGAIEYLIKESADRDVMLTLHWTWEYNIGLLWLQRFMSVLNTSRIF